MSPWRPGAGSKSETITRLTVLAEAGHQYVLISEVLRWLGEDVKPSPAETPPALGAGPEPGADPLEHLGIKPVTPGG